MNISIILLYEALDHGKQSRLYSGSKDKAEEAARKDLLQLMNQQCVIWYNIIDVTEAKVIEV